MTQPISVEKYRDLIHQGELKDPLVYLESCMNGQDPRELSALYTLAEEIQDLSGGDISRSDWSEIYDLICARYKFQIVPLAQSISAAKSLAEYIHPKRKHIDISSTTDNSENSASPLTEEEINIFKEVFNDEF